MPKLELETFRRKLAGDEEPTDHQRKFLYLPSPILRDFTNLRKIIEKYNRRKDNKPLKEIEIKHKIANYHKQMVELDKWKSLHLDELDFIRDEKSKHEDAQVWSLSKEEQIKVHEKLSSHQKQFTYLPLNVLMNATNIREVVLPGLAQGRKDIVDNVIGQIHKQLATKRWYSDLDKLRFVVSIEDDEYIGPIHDEPSKANENVTIKKKVQQHNEPEPQPSTSKAMPKSAKNASKTSTSDETLEQPSRVLRSRTSDLSSDQDESIKKKSKKDVAKPAAGTTKISKTIPKSSAPNVTEDRRITRRMSIEQTPAIRELRKRKSDLTSAEEQLPAKKPNTPVHRPEKSTTKVPEKTRSPKKLADSSVVRKISNRPTRELTPQKNDSSRGDEMPSKKSANGSDPVNGKSKSVQRTIQTWAKPIPRPKDHGDELPKFPKRKVVQTPPSPETTPHTAQTQNLNQTASPTTRNEVGNENNEQNGVVLVSSDSPNINDVAEVVAETDDYDQVENELLDLEMERHKMNTEDRRRQRELCSPSDFQREILDLSFENFITKTNIKELVLKECRKNRNDENFQLSTAAMHGLLEFYYEYRKRIHEWYKNCIKNLKFVHTIVEPRPEQNNSNELAKNSKKKQKTIEINDFQREIMALSTEDFFNETNIREIVERDFYKEFQGKRICQEKDMTFGLNYYEELRVKGPKHWHQTTMTHLKFKTCECKRKKQFDDKCVATDKPIETREIGCGTEFEPNEEQLQLASLTVHAITDSQIICIANLSAEAFESYSGQGASVVEHHDGNDGDDSEPIETQDITVLPSQITPQSGETHYSSPQSGATSGIEVSKDRLATVPSQQILSLAEVRMSEFIEGSAPIQNAILLVDNPLETEDVIPTQNEESHETTPQDSIQFESQENSALVSSTPKGPVGKADLQSQNMFKTPSTSMVNVKVEQNPELEYHLGDDSDVICLGDKSMDFVDLVAENSPSTQELFLHCDDNTLRENLITVHTQPSPAESTEAIGSRAELIDILEGDSPEIEDSESPQNNSPFRNIVNIQPQVEKQQTVTKSSTPNKRRPTIFKPPQSNTNTKKRKTANDDLSTIPVPKYNYRPLEFRVRDKAHGQEQNDEANSHEIDSSQTSPKQTTNYSIEDSSSTDETSIVDSAPSHAHAHAQANGMLTTDSCAERDILLNQDNTLFLGINTQPLYSACTPASNPMIQTSSQPISISTDPTTINQNQNQNENENTNQQPVEVVSAASVPLPGPSSSSSSSSTLSRLNGDRTEFLHYVDIRTIQSSLKSIISASGEMVSCLAIETMLQHQCNANNRVVVMGDALKLIMKLTDKEWAAVKSILTTIGTFHFESKTAEPMDGSLLHRAMYYLFKAASKVSNVHIAYGDSDLETARVFYKPNSSTENITSTINPFVLAAMKAKAQEQQQQQ